MRGGRPRRAQCTRGDSPSSPPHTRANARRVAASITQTALWLASAPPCVRAATNRSQGAPAYWQRSARCLTRAGNAPRSLAQDILDAVAQLPLMILLPARFRHSCHHQLPLAIDYTPGHQDDQGLPDRSAGEACRDCHRVGCPGLVVVRIATLSPPLLPKWEAGLAVAVHRGRGSEELRDGRAPAACGIHSSGQQCAG